ncbi:hypothetical protein Tsubulata_021992 [Turnera subulata]|uniref:Uncharacterized protein n=1 Tax=Turnera subulata TaxID=218843 RepID=A0A9Q0IZY6_9ROSI|nr:hypothetical protein Tsubulata_021992 [Turnera subulata]
MIDCSFIITPFSDLSRNISRGEHSAESFNFKAHDYFIFLVILRHALRPIYWRN